MTDNGFCKGVEILLGRMHSHPEEFEMGITGDSYGSHWRDVCQAIVARKTGKRDYTTVIDASVYGPPLPQLTDKEIDALYERYVEIQKQAFDKEIVRRVFSIGEQNESQKGVGITSGQTTNSNGAYSIGGGSGSGSLYDMILKSYVKDKIS